MTLQDLLALKSGTDVRGTAIGEKTDLTDEAVDAIVRAFLYYAAARAGKRELTLAVGHDSRLSADRISGAAARAAKKSGANVLFCGLCSTPAMFMLLQEKDLGADCSIMVTASHLPSDKNGLKFFLPDGGLEGKDVAEILKLASEGKTLFGEGREEKINYMPRYAAALADKVRAATGKEKPLAGKKIIVDAGNGAGGFYADMVLKPLGADTEGSMFLQPDGAFPNHIPNPENADAMRAICDRVKKTGADFGIIFDTDVDRAGAVDKNGEEINRNKLIALISAILLEEKKGAIVTDSVTSDGLSEFIAARGGAHRRFKRGYKNVIDEAKRLNAAGVYCPLAIETSGHAALKENFFLDDGAYLVTRILISMARGKEISELIAGLPLPAEEAEARLPFQEGADFKHLGGRVLEELKSAVCGADGLTLAKNCFEGVRIDFGKGCGDGWALARMSLHEPILPVNFESNVKGGTKIIAERLYSLLRGYPFLRAEVLKNFFEGEKIQ